MKAKQARRKTVSARECVCTVCSLKFTLRSEPHRRVRVRPQGFPQGVPQGVRVRFKSNLVYAGGLLGW